MIFCVYVLYSFRSGKIYIGFTSDLISRFHSHNQFSKKGWTIRYRPWHVIHCEFYEEKGEAMLREKDLKSGHGRQWIHSLIESMIKL
ncbi:MAG: GIY-YIG nuclease family protein [Bacteroidales bacterium]|nr:GIY-YIG nuclease family protein [Bacteroidales bacterium]